MSTQLPIAVLGAGPVGLAAAAHLAERGLPFVIFESGDSVGASVRRWGHVRLFSPWRTDLDRAAQRLLKAHEWNSPDPTDFPTGADIVEDYLTPLAQLDAIAPNVRLGHRVVGVTRRGVDKLRDDEREERPFIVTTSGPAGMTRTPVRAVIDATGTWLSPNPVGAEGYRRLAKRMPPSGSAMAFRMSSEPTGTGMRTGELPSSEAVIRPNM
jgi:cation diffusion facilitator CzcD-associated flavoprotein CzcO